MSWSNDLERVTGTKRPCCRGLHPILPRAWAPRHTEWGHRLSTPQTLRSQTILVLGKMKETVLVIQSITRRSMRRRGLCPLLPRRQGCRHLDRKTHRSALSMVSPLRRVVERIKRCKLQGTWMKITGGRCTRFLRWITQQQNSATKTHSLPKPKRKSKWNYRCLWIQIASLVKIMAKRDRTVSWMSHLSRMTKIQPRKRSRSNLSDQTTRRPSPTSKWMQAKW